MILLGVCGRARAGKNSVAEGIYLEAQRLKKHVRIYEFSEYVLKDLLLKYPKFPMKREELTSFDLTYLVKHGLSMRQQNAYYWVDELFNDIYRDQPEVAILPNIRFLNEAEAVRSYGKPGKIIRVKSLIRDGVEFISTDRDPNDNMETENLSISADFFLTAKRGQTRLLKIQAAGLFNYILKENKN